MVHDSCCMHRGIHQIASLTKPGSGAGPWNTPGMSLPYARYFPPIYIQHNGTGERDMKATGELCARNQPDAGFGVPAKNAEAVCQIRKSSGFVQQLRAATKFRQYF